MIDDIEVIKSINHKHKSKDECLEIFEFTPTYGYLKPKECQILSVWANPKPNTSFRAKAMILVEGGEAGILSITGISSDVACYLPTDVIEFGPNVSMISLIQS